MKTVLGRNLWALLLLAFLLPCAAQKTAVVKPQPLPRAESEAAGKALVASLLAQRPEQGMTNSGTLLICDDKDQEHEIPVRFLIQLADARHWLSVYETLPGANRLQTESLTVVHTDGAPNEYRLARDGAAPRILKDGESMIPFAGSDFWLADLGLEFLHWPRQRVLYRETRRSQYCDVLESVTPTPAPGGYARVVAWFEHESGALIHAEAFDAKGGQIKTFDPTKVKKINGHYELLEMEIRTQSDAKTRIHFNLQIDSLPASHP